MIIVSFIFMVVLVWIAFNLQIWEQKWNYLGRSRKYPFNQDKSKMYWVWEYIRVML